MYRVVFYYIITKYGFIYKKEQVSLESMRDKLFLYCIKRTE